MATPDRKLSDSIRARAELEPGLHVLISLSERRLQLLDGTITLYTAPVGIGKGGVLEHDGQSWSFHTPHGERRVVAREADPVWVPPLWHYVELARQHGFRLVKLRPGRAAALRDGSRLVVHRGAVHRRRLDGALEALPTREEIVFDETLYVPPLGTANRRVPGELGRFKMDLGEGYLIHGTPDQESVGSAATHGCLRLRETDLLFIYESVPVGTAVYIY